MNDFYDDLAQSYHLIFEDWDTSIIRQGDALSDVILERWGGDIRTVLDVACGIGTQAIVTTTRIMRTRYYAISTRKLMALMQEAGFVDIERNNNAFYQPVLTEMKDMR